MKVLQDKPISLVPAMGRGGGWRDIGKRLFFKDPLDVSINYSPNNCPSTQYSRNSRDRIGSA